MLKDVQEDVNAWDAGINSLAMFTGISDSEASTQKWAATIAFTALQTTNYNVTLAQVHPYTHVLHTPCSLLTPLA